MKEMKFRSLLESGQRIMFLELLATVTLAVLLVSIFILYEAKTAVIQRYIVPDTQVAVVPSAERLALSSASREAVYEFAHARPEIAVVGVVAVDLKENTRTSLMRVFNDKEIEKRVMDADKSVPSGPFPLFTADVTGNAEITALLSGEFTCSTEDVTVFIQKYNLGDKLKQVCRIPVPPYYGRLTGYLVLYSKAEMSIYEKDRLRSAVTRLALDIYRNDVVTVPRYERPMRAN